MDIIKIEEGLLSKLTRSIKEIDNAILIYNSETEQNKLAFQTQIDTLKRYSKYFREWENTFLSPANKEERLKQIKSFYEQLVQ